jgi:NAD-dependent SIR2 family protein deacetylase
MAAARIRAVEVMIVHLEDCQIYKDIANHPVYKEARLTYADLCVPRWLEEDPDVFYGFWGDCFNRYRHTKPHQGYEILKTYSSQNHRTLLKGTLMAWKLQLLSLSLAAMWMEIVRFLEREINEIHGTIEQWQCSKKCTKEC